MSGYSTVLKIRRLEKAAFELGFMFAYPKHRFGGTTEVEQIALKPRDDSAPIYSRDAEVFHGTIEDLEVWLRGVEWARDYDKMLKVSDSKKRERKEKDYANAQLLKTLKNA